MATTVDDLITLKDEAVDCAYNTVETILSVFGESADGAMGSLLAQARAVTERDGLYDAAEASDAVSIEDFEEGHGGCSA
jgi:hypothetical protein